MKTLLEYDSSKDDPDHGVIGNNLPRMIQTYAQKMNFTSTWYSDQDIFTHAILSSGLCSLPQDHSLWTTLNLQPRIGIDDSKTCWKGSALFEDCNNDSTMRNMKLRFHGHNCKWWHFAPRETYSDLKSKFDEIMSNQSENGLMSLFIRAAKTYQNVLHSEIKA